MNTDILPDTTGERNLGSSDKLWKWVYSTGGTFYGSTGTRVYVINTGGTSWLEIQTRKSGYAGVVRMYNYVDGKDVRIVGDSSPWEFRVEFNGTKRMYLTNSGNLYIDGSYNTFSPSLPTLKEVRENPEEHIKQIYKFACIPSSRGKPLPEDEELRRLVLERAFAKNLSWAVPMLARIIIVLYNRIKELEQEIEQLKSSQQ